jgi:hypothetical protein
MRYIFIFFKKNIKDVYIGAKTLKWQKKIILKASIISRWFTKWVPTPYCWNDGHKASSVTDMLKKLAKKIWWII